MDLAGLLRALIYGELLPTWPTDLRMIGRRVPRPVGEHADFVENRNWRYGAFATNTQVGQVRRILTQRLGTSHTPRSEMVARAARTAQTPRALRRPATWPVAFTLYLASSTVPSGPTTTVDRITPTVVLP